MAKAWMVSGTAPGDIADALADMSQKAHRQGADAIVAVRVTSMPYVSGKVTTVGKLGMATYGDVSGQVNTEVWVVAIGTAIVWRRQP